MNKPSLGQDAPSPEILDVTGYRCPVPVIKAEARLRKMAKGEKLLIRADDPIAAVDIPHFCQEAGHGVERLDDDGRFCVFIVTCAGK